MTRCHRHRHLPIWFSKPLGTGNMHEDLPFSIVINTRGGLTGVWKSQSNLVCMWCYAFARPQFEFGPPNHWDLAECTVSHTVAYDAFPRALLQLVHQTFQNRQNAPFSIVVTLASLNVNVTYFCMWTLHLHYWLDQWLDGLQLQGWRGVWQCQCNLVLHMMHFHEHFYNWSPFGIGKMHSF